MITVGRNSCRALISPEKSFRARQEVSPYRDGETQQSVDHTNMDVYMAVQPNLKLVLCHVILWGISGCAFTLVNESAIARLTPLFYES